MALFAILEIRSIAIYVDHKDYLDNQFFYLKTFFWLCTCSGLLSAIDQILEKHKKLSSLKIRKTDKESPDFKKQT